MSNREYDELINKLESIIYPIVFALFMVWCAYEALAEVL